MAIKNRKLELYNIHIKEKVQYLEGPKQNSTQTQSKQKKNKKKEINGPYEIYQWME